MEYRLYLVDSAGGHEEPCDIVEVSEIRRKKSYTITVVGKLTPRETVQISMVRLYKDGELIAARKLPYLIYIERGDTFKLTWKFDMSW